MMQDSLFFGYNFSKLFFDREHFWGILLKINSIKFGLTFGHVKK
jgi:hypothetical protein